MAREWREIIGGGGGAGRGTAGNKGHAPRREFIGEGTRVNTASWQQANEKHDMRLDGRGHEASKANQ